MAKKESDHYKWWAKEAYSDAEFQATKSILDQVNNGTLTAVQINKITQLKGNTPHTYLFLGYICGQLDPLTREVWAGSLKESVSVVKRASEIISGCENIIQIIDAGHTPTYKIGMDLSEALNVDQKVCDAAFWVDILGAEEDKEHPNYIAREDLKHFLGKMTANLKSVYQDETSVKLARKGKGNKIKPEIDIFTQFIIEDYFSSFRKYPVLSESSIDYEVYCLIYDAYGYDRSDRLKKLIAARKRVKASLHI